MNKHITNAQGDYAAWLLENHDTGTVRYASFDRFLNLYWVDNADDAVHFARRVDAERLAENGELHDLRIVDHQWPGGAPRDPVIPEGEWDGPGS